MKKHILFFAAILATNSQMYSGPSILPEDLRDQLYGNLYNDRSTPELKNCYSEAKLVDDTEAMQYLENLQKTRSAVALPKKRMKMKAVTSQKSECLDASKWKLPVANGATVREHVMMYNDGIPLWANRS